MEKLNRRITLVGFAFLMIVPRGSSFAGCEIYRVGFNTEALSGLNGRLWLELTTSGHSEGEDDKVVIDTYRHNAVFEDATTFGAWEQAGGEMADPGCSCGGATWIYSDAGFHNGLALDYSSLGSFLRFHFELFDTQDDGTVPSEFSIFFTGANSYPMQETNDPLGANAILTVETHAACEVLTVYSPALFIAPDSIYVDLSGITDIGHEDDTPSFSVISITPNPSRGPVTLEYMAEPGLISIDVFDIAGRRIWVDEKKIGEAGRGVVTWGGRNIGGGRVAEGVYFIQIKNKQKAIVQKIVISR